MGERSSSLEEKWSTCKNQKAVAKEMLIPTLIWYVIGGEYMLQDFDEEKVAYLSKEAFDELASGGKEADVGISMKAWCRVKLE